MKFSHFSSLLQAAALTGGLWSCSQSAHATDYVWAGAGAGTASDWFSPKNWKATANSSASTAETNAMSRSADASVSKSSGVPGSGDTAVIGGGANVAINRAVTLAALTVQEGSTLQGSGDVTITTTFMVRDAQLSGDGDLKIAPGAWGVLTSQDGANGNSISKGVDNAGTLLWVAGKLALSKDFHNRGKFNIKSNGVLQAAAKAKAAFYNEGTLTKSDDSTTLISVPFNNSGDIYLQGGKLNVGPKFVQTDGSLNLDGGDIASSGTVQVNGGVVDGTGLIDADVVNAGSFKPGHSPGIINISGNYVQTANGVLNMEIGGTSAGSGYDQMNVDGSVYLDGAMNLVKWNNYIPPVGRTFRLLTYYDLNYNFASINGLNPSGNIYYRITRLNSAYTASTYTSNPSS